jgi:hypothetical protein
MFGKKDNSLSQTVNKELFLFAEGRSPLIELSLQWDQKKQGPLSVTTGVWSTELTQTQIIQDIFNYFIPKKWSPWQIFLKINPIHAFTKSLTTSQSFLYVDQQM